MATVELIKNAGAYTVEAVTWTPIQLIPEIGVTQLKIYYTTTNSTVWTELTKNSWKSTYNGMTQTISLKNATYTSDGSEVPAYVNSATHKIKVKRVTSSTLYITFNEGAKLSGRDLNIVNLQCIHLLEEESARLDTADSNIYTYINTSLTNYYTKTEIDESLNNLGLVVSWAIGETYIQGDVVKHNDPNTEENKDLVWYCIASNNGTLQNQPTETGIGSTFWSQQKSTALNSLSYIRKLPGATGEELDWNTIKISNGNSPALKIITNLNQEVDVLSIVDYNNNPLLNFTWDNSIVVDDVVSLWLKGEVYSSKNNWINYTPSQSTIGNPVFSIKGRSESNAVEVVKSTASNNTSNVLFKINDVSIFTGAASHYIDGGTVEFINKLVWFSGTETQDCYGAASLDGNGEPAFTEVRFGRDAKFGTLASCSSPFVQTVHITASTGNITSNGTVTASDAVFDDVTTTNVQNADYLKTDANGKIIAGSGSPTTSRVAWGVTGSNTMLSNRDVVYLNNATGLWTKARANALTTLAVGIIDSVAGSPGNQDFSVVFAGAVSGYINLDVGNWYWLSKVTTGGITSTFPTGSGELIDPVGIAVNSTTLFVVPARPSKLPTV
jgi:hypothetical protein